MVRCSSDSRWVRAVVFLLVSTLGLPPQACIVEIWGTTGAIMIACGGTVVGGDMFDGAETVIDEDREVINNSKDDALNFSTRRPTAPSGEGPDHTSDFHRPGRSSWRWGNI